MSMNRVISALLILQDRDSKINALRNELKRLPGEKQNITQQTVTKEKSFAKAKHDVQETELAIKSCELDIQTRQTSVARLKVQQFETRKNEEYQAIGLEIIRYGNEVEERETQQLDLMEQLDVRRAIMEKARQNLIDARSCIDDEMAKLDVRAQNLGMELEALEVERAELSQDVEEVLLSRYEKLSKSKGLPVVVQMSISGQCGGCHMKVIRAIEHRVKSGEAPVECDNCGRILHD